MRKFYNLILLVVLVLCSRELKAQVNTQDSLALVDLYNSSNGPHWSHYNNWLTTSPVSTWYGVTVNSNRVTSLNLYYNQLNGFIPSSIGNLISLERLDLSSNFYLNGDLPASLGNLTKLYYLNLNYGNHLTGSISFLGKLHNLNDVELSTNQLSGKIPELNDANLSVLNLDGNQLSGSIPTFGKDTASLISINLVHNKLTGGINHQFDSLANLFELFLDFNQLNGKISASLNQFIKLHEIVFSYNQLTGKLPALDSLRNLDLISVAYNQLTGGIPASFNKNTKLSYADFSHNIFSGKLPSLDSLDPYTHIYLQNNQFTFAGMEDIASTFSFAAYSPQANIAITQNGNVLSVAAGGTISNNTYNWYKDGVLFKSNVGTPRLVVHKNGNYSVAVTNSIATQLTLYSDTVAVTGLLQNSIAATETTNNILIYPNPVKTIATVSFNSTGNCTIKLADASGNVLQTKTVVAKGINTLRLDVSKYPSGIYFVSLISEGKQLQTSQLNKE